MNLADQPASTAQPSEAGHASPSIAGAHLAHAPQAHDAKATTFKGRFVKAFSRFWLNFFFFNARYNPWFARGAKQFFLFFVWRFSEHLYGGPMANAAHILGPGSTLKQCEKLARGMLDSFYYFVCDVGQCVNLTRDQIADRIDRVEGTENYEAARGAADKTGAGAIIVSAHMGSFEAGAASLMKREKSMHVLFRRDELGLFEEIRSKVRKTLGVEEAAVDDGWSIWIRLRDALARDEVVLIQGDRVMPGQKGQAMPFFDGHILLPTGPARLAQLSGAPIIPVYSVRLPSGKIRLYIEPAIRIGAGPGEVDQGVAMLQMAQVLEKYVRKFPDQWLENRPAWIEDRDRPAPVPPGKLMLRRLKQMLSGRHVKPESKISSGNGVGVVD